ncbi:MAG: PEP-CTERM sorting domain-containing protein [Planctomycetaceae bacterium]|jgi:hypothetical protein|nr:PEP-CTERM sorting domain-containing protein [Planctomycetaceae bacterium]
MKSYMKLKMVSLTIVLIGLSGFVFADLDNSGSKAPDFTDPSGTAIPFDFAEPGDDQASLGTCAMNPTNGNASGELMDEPIVEPEPQLVSFVNDAQPLLNEMVPQSSNPGTNDSNDSLPLVPNNFPEGSNPPNPLNPTTPEPTTLLIVGMSVVGFVPLVRRYRRK